MAVSPWDVVVVGAGAAGLLAAIRAAELGRRTLLLEKNRKPGVKILMSGGTRCNLTHATDNRGRSHRRGLRANQERLRRHYLRRQREQKANHLKFSLPVPVGLVPPERLSGRR
jgi:predicted flavoprotein YhiN